MLTIPAVAGVLAALALLIGGARSAEAVHRSARSACNPEYDYAGVQDERIHYGIRAELGTATPPQALVGHVAGWLGVGGPGLGPNKTDEWLQTGYVSFEAGPTQIYYEVTQPRKLPAYHIVKATLSVTETHRLTVLEMKQPHGSWRVWLDGRVVSPAIPLPKSHARFYPQAIAETWNGGEPVCNRYGYRFRHVQVARTPGGSWGLTKAGYVWRNRHNLAVITSRDSFVARSLAASAVPSRNEPPLLPSLASRLARRTLTAACVRQRAAVVEKPPGNLLLNEALCETLLGYAVAQPRTPRSEELRFRLAAVALDFLRGVARVGRIRAAAIDCRAVGWFYPALRLLGATGEQALSLRTVLLRNRALLEHKLGFQTGCPFH